MCGACGFRDERDGIDVAAEFAWREVQSNDHVFEKGLSDSSSFVFESEGVDGFFEPFPPMSSDHTRQ